MTAQTEESPGLARDGRSGNLDTNRFFAAPTPWTGLGLFTRVRYERHDVVLILGGAERYWQSSTDQDASLNPNWVGIGKHRWIDPDWPAVYLNHSCQPNLGFRGERELIALRDISPGEELTLDYSITEDELLWQMNCGCRHADCRKVIRSIQFLPREVLNRYLPYVNPYFQQVYEEYVALLGR